MKNETPLLTVPSRSPLRLAPVLVMVALIALCPTLMQANIIAQNTGGTGISISGVYWGQSFTTGPGGPESNIAFNLFSDVPATTPYALGTGFLLTMAYTGAPGGLSSLTPGFIGQTLASGGFWTFNPSLTLLPNTQYFFYENVALGSISGNNFYAGGQYYFTLSDSGNFTGSFDGNSINFRVTGSPATVPDAGSTLPLLSFALLGVAVLRRKLRC